MPGLRGAGDEGGAGLQALRMQARTTVGALLWLAVMVSACVAAPYRSSSVAAAFQRQVPCPATGKREGACPGWVKDHKIPLCAGGADHPSNMQWQTIEAAKAKDREERRQCRRFRSA